MKGSLGRTFISISVLNCSDTCDTRISTSGEDPVGTAGVGNPGFSFSAVDAGPRRERSQARMVGGMAGAWVFDGIYSAVGRRWGVEEGGKSAGKSRRFC